MKVTPIQNYKATQYPTLAQYLKEQGKKGTLLAVALTVGLSALTTLVGGCGAVEIRVY